MEFFHGGAARIAVPAVRQDYAAVIPKKSAYLSHSFSGWMLRDMTAKEFPLSLYVRRKEIKSSPVHRRVHHFPLLCLHCHENPFKTEGTRGFHRRTLESPHRKVSRYSSCPRRATGHRYPYNPQIQAQSAIQHGGPRGLALP